MRKLSLVILSFLTLSITGFAQQDAEYSMYMFNGLYTNPAYAGSQDVISLTALYRHQWVGVDGRPQSGTFSIHSPLKKDQYALGAIFLFDKLGVDNTYGMYLDYAYKLKFKNGLKWSFGIQAGATYYESRLYKLKPGDPFDSELKLTNNILLPNVGFGTYLYSKRFFVGASAPHILNLSLSSEKIENGTTREDIARLYNHMFFTAGIVTGKDETKVKFKPSFMIKYVRNAPISTDLNASVLLVNRLWLGLGYRFGVTKNANNKIVNAGNRLIGMVEGKITPQLRVGYAYDGELDRIKTATSGSHEIMLGYDFGFDKARFVTPRYVTYF